MATKTRVRYLCRTWGGGQGNGTYDNIMEFKTKLEAIKWIAKYSKRGALSMFVALLFKDYHEYKLHHFYVNRRFRIRKVWHGMWEEPEYTDNVWND